LQVIFAFVSKLSYAEKEKRKGLRFPLKPPLLAQILHQSEFLSITSSLQICCWQLTELALLHFGFRLAANIFYNRNVSRRVPLCSILAAKIGSLSFCQIETEFDGFVREIIR
jgi:hypothetical protein